jgi:pimeloyl-ACP methyl ester carboxylesterase
MAITAFRTPDARFARLPDFPYGPIYLDDLVGFEGLRAAVVDEGPSSAQNTFLCLHGEPTWSFLYRKMIPVFRTSGARVVAPDFFGFGRSDKPTNEGDYSFDFHRRFLIALIGRLDLRNITLVVQDWGGVLGLTLPVDPSIRPRIARVLVLNTGIPVGEPAQEGFAAWRSYVSTRPDLPVGKLLKRSVPFLSPDEEAAYEAPFPDAQSKAGVRAFPTLFMTEPAMQGVAESRAARAFWSTDWAGKSFMAYGATDPIFPPAQMEALRAQIRGCPPAMVVADGGHFVQEWGKPIAEAALESFK